MKAYGLANLLRYSMGVTASVAPSGDETYLEVTSALDPEQLKQLQILVEANGWELFYSTTYTGCYLAIKERG